MKWQIRPKAPSAFFRQFPEFSPLIVQLLYNRNLRTQQQIDEFFNPDFQEDIYDPFLLRGIRKAVKRVLRAIEKQEKIVVYGDFDADGVCAAAIVFLTLQALGVKNLDVYIPDREKENHGLNKESVKKLAQAGTKLIVVVDCASNDLEEVKLASSLGVDIIITDHHQSGDNLPKAIAFINPLQKGDKYPFKDLAGAGVAYKLACALLSSEEILLKDQEKDSLKKWLLDLVALATVADVMPVIGENRTLVKYGLAVLAQTRWLGLRELMKLAQLNPQVIQASLNGEAPSTNLDTYTLGYILGPRLNAAGRMDHANKAFQLLVTQNKEEAESLAQEINQSNLARQNLTDKIVQEVKKRVEEKFNQNKKPKLIFEGSPDWPIGLVGLVAGKIADKYRRPTVVYHQRGELIHASCRSIPQFDLMEMLSQGVNFFDDFGGHKGSAGFRMRKKNLGQVEKLFNKIAEEQLKDEDLSPVLDIDAELSLSDITWQNYDQIQCFAPFGRANPKPVFLTRGVEISGLRIVGNNGQHLKMELILFDDQLGQGKSFKAIGFGLGEWQNKLKVGDLVDVVFELIVNQWNGQRDLEMKIVDIRCHSERT
jgi:single-stranded-DNA-specific exonuclease